MTRTPVPHSLRVLICTVHAAYGTPPLDDYSARLRGLLVPTPAPAMEHGGHLMIRHDPITGMPTDTYTVYPVVGPGGEIVMLDSIDVDDPVPELREDDDSDSDAGDLAVHGDAPQLTALEPADAIPWGPGAPFYLRRYPILSAYGFAQ